LRRTVIYWLDPCAFAVTGTFVIDCGLIQALDRRGGRPESSSPIRPSSDRFSLGSHYDTGRSVA